MADCFYTSPIEEEEATLLPETLGLYEIPLLDILEAVVGKYFREIGYDIEERRPFVEGLVREYGRAIKAAIELRKEEYDARRVDSDNSSYGE